MKSRKLRMNLLVVGHYETPKYYYFVEATKSGAYVIWKSPKTDKNNIDLVAGYANLKEFKQEMLKNDY